MRYFLGFLAAIGLIVLVFILVLRGFSGHKTQGSAAAVLSDYANTETIMQLVMDGPVTADQNHQSLRITVGRTSNTIEIMQGYQGSVTQTKTYVNNQEAYTVFLRSLQLLNYTKGNNNASLADERGYCPLGNRYIYEVVSGAATVQRYWNSTCSVGTFKGNAATVRSLFRQQIPDYDQLTRTLTVH